MYSKEMSAEKVYQLTIPRVCPVPSTMTICFYKCLEYPTDLSTCQLMKKSLTTKLVY
jgi:hypothetical protein